MNQHTDKMRFSLDEYASLEAAEIALRRSHNGKKFDAYTFKAIAKYEAEKLRKDIDND
jgi:hypothetical protein